MFFWGYIEDVKREIVTDFNISVTPIRTSTATSVGTNAFGNGYINTDTYTTGGTVSSKTEHKTIWTFDIGDTSFKLISDTMHLKNGDFVVVESYFRDGVYYMIDCIYNATKSYAEPNNFPCYLERISEPTKPNLKLKIGKRGAIYAILFVIFYPIISSLGGSIIIWGFIIIGVVIAYSILKSYSEQYEKYERELKITTEKNKYIELHNAEYKKYENEIISALKKEVFSEDKLEAK